ncbi:AraC family transcriptional regulator [Amylibacter marinus]|uniref:AraC family transcriptional regulator n=1 Tax=Amylibacter marinus TaxID=1475483 RepID=A0ABQ5VSQ0_9RHOB|nr:helix-turn-helix domain-containing protein [Amylibacter marinus]GLQ34214.1 AraC family transcriptional regulator [Amylibacter marinus]
MTLQSYDGGKSVFVAAIPGNRRNVSAEIRLDGANDYHKFIYLNTGTACAIINGQRHDITPHSLLYIPAPTPHKITLSPVADTTCIALHKSLNIPQPDHSVITQITSVEKQANYSALFDRALSQYIGATVGSRMALRSYVATLNAQIEHSTATETKPKAAQRLMRRFVTLLENKYKSGANLEFYARELGVTSTHLTRVCQQIQNTSASQVIQDRLLAEARRLLLVGDQKIQDISSQLGFRSAAYFSRFFTNHETLSPKEFRQQARRVRTPTPIAVAPNCRPKPAPFQNKLAS